MTFEEQYLTAVEDVLITGIKAKNRTGIDTLYKHGLYMKINMDDGFPLLTTKKVPWKSAVGEMLGFIRGYDNAADFRALGCKVWDANANENEAWLANSNRRGVDDINRCYGQQWRKWRGIDKRIFAEDIQASHRAVFQTKEIDQLRMVYDDLLAGIDNRREIITAWNPAELDEMALPPCHMTMQFGLGKRVNPMAGYEDVRELDLSLYIRSNDMGLGMPFNAAQYAWLLTVMAQITGHVPGTLHYFAFNHHIYVNHIEALKAQLKRPPRLSPLIDIHPRCSDLEFLEKTTIPIDEWTYVSEYHPHSVIKMEMAI